MHLQAAYTHVSVHKVCTKAGAHAFLGPTVVLAYLSDPHHFNGSVGRTGSPGLPAGRTDDGPEGSFMGLRVQTSHPRPRAEMCAFDPRGPVNEAGKLMGSGYTQYSDQALVQTIKTQNVSSTSERALEGVVSGQIWWRLQAIFSGTAL